jgi:gamma-glutamyltranspeptidase/glutathione hydrolase
VACWPSPGSSRFHPLLRGGGRPEPPRTRQAPAQQHVATIVLQHGKPLLAVGSPGGATIITTVLQTLVNRVDLGMSLPEAVAAPRLSQRNRANTEVEPAFLDSPPEGRTGKARHKFVLASQTFTPAPEIGAVAALEFLGDGDIQAVAEAARRGGGSAMVLRKND